VGVWLFDQHTQGQAVQPISDPARHGSNSRVGRSGVASRIRAAWLAGTPAPPHSPEHRPRITLRVGRAGQTGSASVTTVATSVHRCNGPRAHQMMRSAPCTAMPPRRGISVGCRNIDGSAQAASAFSRKNATSPGRIVCSTAVQIFGYLASV
jgi:hypothetical protein